MARAIVTQMAKTPAVKVERAEPYRDKHLERCQASERKHSGAGQPLPQVADVEGQHPQRTVAVVGHAQGLETFVARTRHPEVYSRKPYDASCYQYKDGEGGILAVGM